MKVLLWGEFSGVHCDLSDALLEFGHTVELVTTGDGFKNFSGSLNLPMQPSGFFSKFVNYPIVYRSLNQIKDRDYDVVQLINPYVNYWFFSKKVLSSLLKMADVRSLLVCGNDYYVNQEYARHRLFELWAEEYNQKKGLLEKAKSILFKQHNDWIVKQVDLVIPCTRGLYRSAYRSNSKLSDTIPFPVKISKLPHIVRIEREKKLKFFHGVSSRKEKGSDLILSALKDFVTQYPDSVELRVVKQLPIGDYLKEMSDCDVVIDQTGGDAFGMNSLYAMGMGKALLTSFCRESVYANCPAICINGTLQSIKMALESILENRIRLGEIGEEGRKYVLENHDSHKVAQKYLDLWRRNIK